MTRAEAINILKHPSEMYQGTDGIVGYTFNPNKRNYEAFQLAIKALHEKNAPSVKAARKVGKWNILGCDLYICSKCYAKFTHKFNYCPNCGAEMEIEK